MQQSVGSQWAHAGQLRRGDCHCVVPLCTLCTVHSLHSALLVEAFVEDEPILPRGRRGRLYDDPLQGHYCIHPVTRRWLSSNTAKLRQGGDGEARRISPEERR